MADMISQWANAFSTENSQFGQEEYGLMLIIDLKCEHFKKE